MSQTESKAAAGENAERGTRCAFVCAGALSDKGCLVHMPDPKADPYLPKAVAIWQAPVNLSTYSALQCHLHNKVSKNIFGFLCSLRTLLDGHASGPDLTALGILNISHPTLIAPPVSDEMQMQIIVWHDEQHLSVQEITGLVGCSVRTVYSILSYHHDYNTLRDPSTHGLHGTNRSLCIYIHNRDVHSHHHPSFPTTTSSPSAPSTTLQASSIPQATKTGMVSQFPVSSRIWIHPSSNQNCDGVAVSGSLKTPRTLTPRPIL